MVYETLVVENGVYVKATVEAESLNEAIELFKRQYGDSNVQFIPDESK